MQRDKELCDLCSTRQVHQAFLTLPRVVFLTGAGADIDNPVTGGSGLHIVFHHDDRIPG